ncbi:MULTISPECIES: ParB/RepB/Spo0J family partition protein [unclassified Thermoanaerobacterium]|uniref:ParB/RepB/Spo0J family partition protein n=1 Tax=unclassified Thermoanaerobacterium TaxID=2622527 RepID=UPI000A14E245|nr:ParB/RepB/Spo0J family partition protein [Thermoanaerobacterium sp. PSU-2]MDE4542985.1 ParB/RepB/Spo0J family partition protein [Thermoanaerobacterium sp. R66]ORX22774.1 chromosome partitioning protein ParB [Thermoanaerobacterium sp. PSU-2]HHV74541.1 ParB/RepB/Spo0J family partition protein [Thermoanaerobacterium sp.]
MNNKRGLGRGLQALIPEIDEESAKGVESIKISDIEPNQFQPRKHFDDESLKELSDSIKEHGIIQPIIVRKNDFGYQIVAGERRWRAAKLAGLKEVPAIVKDFDDQKVMEIALIENLQREDLNPIDEAKAYKSLMEQFNLTQEEISKRVGKSRSSIANSIRLLNLDEEVQNMLMEGKITTGHAKVILALQDAEKQNMIAKKIVDKNLNVRDTENLIKEVTSSKKKKRKESDAYIKEIEDNFCRFFGTKVKIIHGKNRGKILIEYYGDEDLSRLAELIIDR